MPVPARNSSQPRDQLSNSSRVLSDQLSAWLYARYSEMTRLFEFDDAHPCTIDQPHRQHTLERSMDRAHAVQLLIHACLPTNLMELLAANFASPVILPRLLLLTRLVKRCHLSFYTTSLATATLPLCFCCLLPPCLKLLFASLPHCTDDRCCMRVNIVARPRRCGTLSKGKNRARTRRFPWRAVQRIRSRSFDHARMECAQVRREFKRRAGPTLAH
jgi:hypothetical protein